MENEISAFDYEKENLIRRAKSRHYSEQEKVLYVPAHVLKSGDKSAIYDPKNLGIVTSYTDRFVFVKYKGQSNSQATEAEDLFSIEKRPDLKELLVK